MATVQLRPGDTLNIMVPGSVNSIALGMVLETEAVLPFTYDDLISLAARKGGKRRHGRSGPRSKTSRQIALYCASIEKGVWSTGAPIKRSVVMTKLNDLLGQLKDCDTLTPKAIMVLGTTLTHPSVNGSVLGDQIKRVLGIPKTA